MGIMSRNQKLVDHRAQLVRGKRVRCLGDDRRRAGIFVIRLDQMPCDPLPASLILLCIDAHAEIPLREIFVDRALLLRIPSQGSAESILVVLRVSNDDQPCLSVGTEEQEHKTWGDCCRWTKEGSSHGIPLGDVIHVWLTRKALRQQVLDAYSAPICEDLA